MINPTIGRKIKTIIHVMVLRGFLFSEIITTITPMAVIR